MTYDEMVMVSLEPDVYQERSDIFMKFMKHAETLSKHGMSDYEVRMSLRALANTLLNNAHHLPLAKEDDDGDVAGA